MDSNSCDIFCAFNFFYFNTKAPHSTKHMGDMLNKTCSKKCFEFHFLKMLYKYQSICHGGLEQ